MAEKISKWQKFKKFCKRNMTPTWARHFLYQVVSFIISVAMVAGVATYAFTKSYDDMELDLPEYFTVTADSGTFDTDDNTLEYVKQALDDGVDIIEVDVRQRPDGTVVMGNELITTNSDGVEISAVLELVKNTTAVVNFDIKEIKCLENLHDLLVEYDFTSRVFLTGIEYFQAKYVPEKCPDVDFYINYVPSRIKIFSDDYQQKILDMLEEYGAIGINCNYANAGVTLCDVLHNNGYKLSVWSVDKKRTMKRMLIVAPDNITTHKYIALQDLIDNWGK